MPDEIARILHQYATCFDTPTKLPPHRPFDHKIDLMPGVQPANVKLYRYSPQQQQKVRSRNKCEKC
jgi:hypothetical protein